MKETYDRETDSLLITLRDAPIRESAEVRPGVIADFNEAGGVLRCAILQASLVVEDTDGVQVVKPRPLTRAPDHAKRTYVVLRAQASAAAIGTQGSAQHIFMRAGDHDPKPRATSTLTRIVQLS